MWIRRRRRPPSPPPSSIASSDETLPNKTVHEVSSLPVPVADDPNPQETPNSPMFKNNSNAQTCYRFYPPPFNLCRRQVGRPRTNLVPVIFGGTKNTIPPHNGTKVKKHLVLADSCQSYFHFTASFLNSPMLRTF